MKKRLAVRKITEGPSAMLRRCKIVSRQLESGEIIERGCGQKGLVPFYAGWKCLYCGNTIFLRRLEVEQLWFQFKLGREYWRASYRNSLEYINGVPVESPADPLPRYLVDDLLEPDPPAWFFYFLVFDEEEFKRYLEMQRA